MPPFRLLVALLLVLAGCAGGGLASGGADHEPPPNGQAVGETAAPSPEPTTSVEPARATVPPLHPSVDAYPEALVSLRGDDVAFDLPVKLADDAERRAHGLMEVEALPEGTGMLFVFDEDRDGGFWMKDTLVPLDIAFVASDGEIHTIVGMEPCDADPCPSYQPDRPYRTALEVPQGWFDGAGIAVGDRLDWQPLDTTTG